MPGDPFQIQSLPSAPLLHRAALGAARPLVSWLLRAPTCRALLQQSQHVPGGAPFETRALDALGIRPACSMADVASIPTHGPLVVAANHPHGAVDGLVLASLVRRARPDVRILANHLLSRIPELAELCFFVDPFGRPGATARSRAGLRAAYTWLKQGGALIVFPAGEVAHARQPDGSYSDSPWLPTTGRMVLATGADVVPAFIAGTNSRWFHAAGRVHASFRTALLARELLNVRGQEVAVRFGPPLSTCYLTGVAPDATAVTQSIRAAVERLRAVRFKPHQRPAAHFFTRSKARHDPRVDAIASDIARLPADACLVESGRFQVFCARARQIPSVLLEIGRLREATYRAVGEGTGRSLDLDAFDTPYLHLFSWDRDRRQIVGAYRLGQTDRIMATEGVTGLYTRTLFRYDQRLIARLSPALELGRSFVRAEYQKNYTALLLLWKGISRFVVRHPQYRVLFGPVSISARYSDSSHRLLMAFLLKNHLDRDLAQLVEAIHPRELNPARPLSTAIPQTIEEADRLVRRAEAGDKGVPILLRQYLKLNARVIGFNVDPNFGDALDALMMVDLAAVDPAILSRYFGPREAAQFLARHGSGLPAHAA
ncbi:MAG: GNAT family N-acyltransferase [Acidobacteriota bacterium]